MEISLQSLTDRFAFADPAGKKKEMNLKRVRARSAIIVVAPDSLGRLFVLYAWAQRCSTNELTDQILYANDAFQPKLFGIEANAMQELYADMVGRIARDMEKKLPLTAVKQPTNVEKDWRIRSAIQPAYAEGRLFIQPHQYELRQEIVSFPMSATKDLVDALASAIKMVPIRELPRQKHEQIELLARYLRESGAPPWYIEQRIEDELKLLGESGASVSG